MMKKLFTVEDIREEVNRLCNLHGELAISRQYKVSQSHLRQLRDGTHGVGAKTLKAFGYEAVYRKIG